MTSPLLSKQPSPDLSTQTQELAAQNYLKHQFSQTSDKVWKQPTNGLQAFKLVKLVFQARNQSINQEIQKIQPTSLKPIIQRGFSQRGKVTVANCLGDAIGNNIDYKTFAPDNNKQLIRKTYEEVKDRLKSETHGVFYSNVSTPKRKREIYVNDISLQQERKLRENRKAIELITNKLHPSHFSRRMTNQIESEPFQMNGFNTARNSLNSCNQISVQETLKSTDRNGTSVFTTQRASECQPFTLKDHLGGDISAYISCFESRQKQKLAQESQLFGQSFQKPEDSVYSVDIQSQVFDLHKDPSEMSSNQVSRNQAICRPNLHTGTVANSKIVHQNVLYHTRQTLVDAFNQSEAINIKDNGADDQNKQIWQQTGIKTMRQRVVENEAKHRLYKVFNSPDRTQGKLPVIAPHSQHGDRKFIVPKKVQKPKKVEMIDQFEFEIQESVKGWEPTSPLLPQMSEINSPTGLNRKIKLTVEPMSKKQSSVSQRGGQMFNLGLKKQTTKIAPSSKYSQILELTQLVSTEVKKNEGPQVLENEIINELVKCYLEKRKMVLDGQIALFNAEEIASTKSKDSGLKGSQPQRIDLKMLSKILARDLAARQIRDEIEVARLTRSINRRTSRLSNLSLTTKMDTRFEVLFEEFQQHLMDDCSPKLPLNISKRLYDDMTEQEKAFYKIITKKEPIQPKLIEIMAPEQEQMLLKKPEGLLIATNAAFKLMKLLVDSYKQDESKIENKLVNKLKNTFQKALKEGADKDNKKRDQYQGLEAKVIDWDDDSSDTDDLTDSSFVDNDSPRIGEKGYVKQDSFDSQIQSEKSFNLNKKLETKQQLFVDKMGTKLEKLYNKQVSKKMINFIDIEKNPENYQIKVLREQGSVFEFYLDQKKIWASGNGLHAALASKNANPSVNFIEKCIEKHVTPVPAFQKISGRTFCLQDTWINDDQAEALQAYFTNYDDEIRTLILERNGLKDTSLAKILLGLKDKKIEKMSLYGNQIGLQTLIALKNLFNQNLKALELGEIKFVDKVQERYGINLLPLSRLRSLTLSCINISIPATFHHFKTFIETDNLFLRELNLTWAYLNEKQLVQLVHLINDNKRTLTSLNLSFNANQRSTLSKQPSDHQRQLISLFVSYLKNNNFLNHLNLSGMQLGDSVIELVPAIKTSTILNSVHLSDNGISSETKQLLFNLFGQDMQLAKKKCNQKVIKCQQDNYQTSAQAMIINHQLSQDAKDQVRQLAQKKAIDQRDPFVLQRFTGHPEFSTKIQQNSGVGQALKLDDTGQKWKISLSDECWVCDRWNYVMVFFNKNKCKSQMEMLEYNSELYQEIHQHVFSQETQPLNEAQSKTAQKSPYSSMTTKQQTNLKKPIITGSVCGWQSHEMTELWELMEKFSMINDIKNKATGQGSLTQMYKQSFVKRRQLNRRTSVRKDQMEDSLQSKLLEEIRKQIPCASEAVVLNQPDELTLSQTQPGDYFVWMGYVKPGNHSCIVARSLDNPFTSEEDDFSLEYFQSTIQMFKRNFIVSIRKEDVDPPQAEAKPATSPEVKTELERDQSLIPQYCWQSENFMFQSWRKDDESSKKIALKCDQVELYMKELCKGCIANEDQRIIEQLQTNYNLLQEVYIDRACRSESYPGIDLINMQQMCMEWEIPGIDAITVEKIFQIVTRPLDDAQDNVEVLSDGTASGMGTTRSLFVPKSLQTLDNKLPNTVRHLGSIQPQQGFSQAMKKLSQSASNNPEPDKPMFIKERLDLNLGTRFNFASQSLLRFQFFNFLALLALTYSFDFINKELQKTLLQTQQLTIEQVLEDKGVNKKELRIAESLNHLIHNQISKNNVFRMRSVSFRTEQLWGSDINSIFESINEKLSLIYYELLEQSCQKKVFNFNSAIKLCDRLLKLKIGDEAILFNQQGQQVYAQSYPGHPAGGYLYNIFLTDSDMRYCFGMSKMTVIDEITHAKQYFKLKYVEFLEFVARLASVAKLQLSSKIQVKNAKAQEEQISDGLKTQYPMGHLQVIRRQLVPGLTESTQLADDIQSLLIFMQLPK